MTEFDIEQFETRLNALVAAHERLKADYAALQNTLTAEQRKNEQTRQRLGRVIERIRALETQAVEGDQAMETPQALKTDSNGG